MKPAHLAFAIACIAALALSGCSSKSTDNGGATGSSGSDSGTGGSTGTDGSSGTGGPGASGNATGTPSKCTATPGGVVGAGGSNGATVSGCTLATLKADSKVTKLDIPSGCDASYDSNGDGLSDGAPKEGETYKSGTTISMGCGATNAQATGTIWLLEA